AKFPVARFSFATNARQSWATNYPKPQEVLWTFLEIEALRSSQAQILNAQRASLNYAALLIPRRINNVEHHGEKKIANQHRERGVHHRLSGGPTDANCSLACGQSFVATDEYDEYPETERF